MNSRMIRALPLMAGLATLSGCISFGAKPPATLLRLTPEQAAPAGPATPLAPGSAVTVMIPVAPTELATTRVPVRSGQTDLAYVKGAQWTDAPARLFRDLLAEAIRARTGRIALDPRDYHLAPGLRLAGRIQQFGLDAGSMQVVMVYDATLQRSDNQIETRRFEAHAPASGATETGVAAGLNSAANQVADQVADWVGR
jgi:cholesterol transport system auxiliary component